MSETTQEKNKALVLDAFDTLFNKRDYMAAQLPGRRGHRQDRAWSSRRALGRHSRTKLRGSRQRAGFPCSATNSVSEGLVGFAAFVSENGLISRVKLTNT